MEVRWNSIYSLIERLIEQKDVVNALCIEYDTIPELNVAEWNILRALKTILQPIYETTTALQSRREHLGTVIPTYKALVYKLKKMVEVGLPNVRRCIIQGLEDRMKGWDQNK